MTKPVLVSGIQPSGRLHIGNYLGMLKNAVDLQNTGRYQCYYFIADLHSLTEDFDPREKTKQILETTADCLAAGLDPKKSVIFQQSQVPAHSELAWIFNTLTSMGELRRMTQFKEKSESQKENVNAGLFTYPTLMAADVLLYDAKYVPVGEDQLQHLELMRTLARKFNARFPARRLDLRSRFGEGGSLGGGGGKTFIEPQPLLTEAPRVMSLLNPAKKMSKSEPSGCLFIDDSPAEIRKKVMRAVTDSGTEIKYDAHKKPALSNLLKIYSVLSGEPVARIEKIFKGKGYADFKTGLAGVITKYFEGFRKKKSELLARPSTLVAILRSGSRRANYIAEKKITTVKRRVGVRLL